MSLLDASATSISETVSVLDAGAMSISDTVTLLDACSMLIHDIVSVLNTCALSVNSDILSSVRCLYYFYYSDIVSDQRFVIHWGKEGLCMRFQWYVPLAFGIEKHIWYLTFVNPKTDGFIFDYFV